MGRLKDSLPESYWRNVEETWETDMAFEQRDNSGALFKNDRKEAANQPDYTGNGMVNGKEVQLAAWIKEIKSGDNAGRKFFSIAFSEPKKKEQRSDPPSDFDDDIPF